MGFKFRKSIKIIPGVKLNVGKKGISSISVGKKGATLNINKDGKTTGTVGIPGTGLSYSKTASPGKSGDRPKAGPVLTAIIIIVVFGIWFWFQFQ